MPSDFAGGIGIRHAYGLYFIAECVLYVMHKLVVGARATQT
jgi:hypothetical protein